MECPENFDLDSFARGEIIVQCEAEDEAKEFLKMIKAEGGVWNNDDDLEEDTCWSKHKKETFYESVGSRNRICIVYGCVNKSYGDNELPNLVKWGDVVDECLDMHERTESELIDFITG